ncbi:MAG: aminotransferase class I/II-fold pyridoxal phosphate-dependent enzyme [Candidatus Obscuribacterales bacterium]|nr:aminotransferase class I/II-fold pyridoxal phosphate-dependent enzyme [Candidatus Obscuribacterales bacterium]
MIWQNTVQLSNLHDEQPLTEIEALGLASRHDLANGHASQELAPSQQRIIDSLPELWVKASKMKSSEAGFMFRNAFCLLAKTPSLTQYESFKICPTASNSIDTVAAWLSEQQMHTALIEPTFDNLYLILKRRGVQLTSFPESALHNEATSNSGNFRELLADVDAIFLVNPNNPTGAVLTQHQFTSIVEWCAVNQKVLILDNTFRFFVPQTYDMYQILLDAGVTFLSIEDTGKVWPTQEIKASLLVTSADIFKEVDLIYDEIFLCHSNFALAILTEFLLDAYARGLEEAVWKAVAERRAKFRSRIEGTILEIHPDAISSTISVEWVTIKGGFSTDLDLVAHFKQHNLVFLPGRQFFWNSNGALGTVLCARFALLKPEDEFSSALSALADELEELY